MFATSKSADAVYLAGGDGVADAIDFDGTNDYLSRASDLVGNVDGKTFTFSCWVWRAQGDTQSIYESNVGADATNDRVQVRVSGNLLEVLCRNSSGTIVMLVSSTLRIPYETWTHILLSFDLANVSLRYLYINDNADGGSWNTYSTSGTIDFTATKHLIAADDYNATKLKNRLSHLFLAYEYIDLSIESNRRIFITADRKPA